MKKKTKNPRNYGICLYLRDQQRLSSIVAYLARAGDGRRVSTTDAVRFLLHLPAVDEILRAAKSKAGAA